jgi:hypothetical protein
MSLRLKHRPEWQRDYLEKRYRQRTGQPKRTSAIDSARRHAFGITVRYEHWQPDPIASMDATGTSLPLAGTPSTGSLRGLGSTATSALGNDSTEGG